MLAKMDFWIFSTKLIFTGFSLWHIYQKAPLGHPRLIFIIIIIIIIMIIMIIIFMISSWFLVSGGFLFSVVYSVTVKLWPMNLGMCFVSGLNNHRLFSDAQKGRGPRGDIYISHRLSKVWMLKHRWFIKDSLWRCCFFYNGFKWL